MNEHDPFQPQSRRTERWVYFIYLPFTALAIGLVGWLYQWDFKKFMPDLKDTAKETAAINEAYAVVLNRLKITPLSAEALKSEKVVASLRELQSAPCDKTAIFKLADGLAEVNAKRPAADALLGFSGSCPNSEGELYRAGRVLFNLGDYAASLPVLDKLVADRPEAGQYRYMRGQIHQFLANHQKAIQDFTSAMALVDNVADVNDQVFADLAKAYSAAGRHCEAMTAIQSYVFVDARTRDNAATRQLIADYAAKGGCDNGYAKGKEVIRKNGRDVVTAKVMINGVPGTFVIDTGASLVAIDAKFAEKAQFIVGDNSRVRFHTANGQTEAALTTAKSVKLGSVSAGNVAIAIIDKPIGPGIDGLLGMSFLARFDVTIKDTDVTIQSRAETAATSPAK